MYDRLTITPSDRLSLTVHPDDAGVPADRSNLAWRAAEAIADESGRAPDVKIQLEKSIPAAAGLGGG
ncbi:MAG: 4-(cytidine 5'-diphospho)-2-C-methyl-D-erythritol kinase, partial [Planctomycetota bacterium]|nr:4-(cytidine 5'-diphospho)-2-C-methyl-D-erythritol kinase [Planctomycetota bacterium]